MSKRPRLPGAPPPQEEGEQAPRIGPRRGEPAAFEPREAFGMRRIPALSLCWLPEAHKVPEYGALQTLRDQGGKAVFSMPQAFEDLREKVRLLALKS